MPVYDKQVVAGTAATRAVRPGTVDPGRVEASPHRCTTALSDRDVVAPEWLPSAVELRLPPGRTMALVMGDILGLEVGLLIDGRCRAFLGCHPS